MKKVLGGLAILLVVGLVIAGCSNPVSSTVVSRAGGAKGAGDIVWNGKADKDVGFVTLKVNDNASDRSNASGAKITSNAHNSDFPGIYFIWDYKQPDVGFLKVHESVFDGLKSFRITLKASNKGYLDCDIEPTRDDNGNIIQSKTADPDNCYIFLIDLNGKAAWKDLNMVFVTDYVNNAKPYFYATPMFSNSSIEYVAPENPADLWGQSWDPSLFVYNDKYGNNIGTAQYTWTKDQAGLGTTDPVNGQTVDMTYEYTIPGNVLLGSISTPFTIAADNAFILIVNDKVVANSANFADTDNVVGNDFTRDTRTYDADGVQIGGHVVLVDSNGLLNEDGVQYFRDTFIKYPEYIPYLYDARDWTGVTKDDNTIEYPWQKPVTIQFKDMGLHLGSNTIEVLAYNSPDHWAADASSMPDKFKQASVGTPESNPACILFAGTVYSKYDFTLPNP